MVIEKMIEEKIYSEENFLFWNAQFLDRFYANPDEKLLEEEPPCCGNIDRLYYAWQAGTNEYLANKYKFSVPEWVYKDFYYINKKPYFRLPNNAIVNIIFCPEEFRLRSVFILGRDMVRV